MEWLNWLGTSLVAVSVGVLAIGSDRVEMKDGLPRWLRVSLVITVFISLCLFAIGTMMETFKDALDSNPYKKEYLYKQGDDGAMEKYDSLYVIKR